MLTSRVLARTIVMIPTGALKKKIQRQPSVSVSAPPTSAPSATAIPTVAPQAAIALPRSGPWNSWPISASPVANIAAPPRPCSARAAIRSDGALGRPAQDRGGREHAETGHENGLATEEVGQRPERQDERCQRQGVGIDHPLQVGEAATQLAVDRRQRDLHDRRCRPAA